MLLSIKQNIKIYKTSVFSDTSLFMEVLLEIADSHCDKKWSSFRSLLGRFKGKNKILRFTGNHLKQFIESFLVELARGSSI